MTFTRKERRSAPFYLIILFKNARINFGSLI